MTTTNHTSPSGDDTNLLNHIRRDIRIELARAEAELNVEGVRAFRRVLAAIYSKIDAALTAEKVAAEPVMLQHVAVAEDGGKLRWMTGRRPHDCELYAMPDGGRAPKLYAAPQQPAQSAEQDERVTQWQSRVRNVSCAEWINITEEGAATIREKYSDAYELRALFDRAASTQSTATHPVHDERAAFVSGRDVEELFLRWSEWTTELGEAISRKNIDGFVSDLRALPAAQPVSGVDHD